MRIVLSIALLMPTLIGSAMAEDLRKNHIPPRAIGVQLVQARYVDQAVARILGHFRATSPDGKVLSNDDVELLAQIDLAQARASSLTRILRADLNGDGDVTRSEIERVVDMQVLNARKEQAASGNAPSDEAARNEEMARRDDAIDYFLKVDANQDGIIAYAEMRAFADAEIAAIHNRSPRKDLILYLVQADPNGDGRVDTAEVEAITRSDFAAIDLDSSGDISNEETRIYDKATADQIIEPSVERPAEHPGCRWPGLAKGANVRVISVYEGATIPSVSVSGQDRETSAVRVVVPAGETPLDVLLTSFTETIFVFEGAVDRVRSAAVLENSRAVGVANIRGERIYQLDRRPCGLPEGTDDRDIKAAGAIEKKLIAGGASDAKVTIAYSLFDVDLLSGDGRARPAQPVAPPEGSDPEIWESMRRFSPGGLIALDVASVWVSGGRKAETYDVMPQGAGLLQLAREGVITLVREKGISRDTYKVLLPMRRFPAGLAGALSVVYLQPGEFPVPDGDIGHSCMLDAATGEVIFGSRLSCKASQPR